ncbi:neutral ceramidase [Agrilus planipennis]|uniref:Neutral ceramidase n=1 Tax=Agrilus planipennis TaxID=224129 RepID=A0A1W4WKF1_AGRPL|nr:neutral ceramidase [Agrilus planipennis]XP_018320937.1 neutral ceramidase [Agrilus planipennis]
MAFSRSCSLLFLGIFCTCGFVDPYRVGVGIADVTGPVAEVTFMGYAKLEQKGMGLHLRQYSRAFVIEDNGNRMLFVSVDVGMIGPAMRKEVLERLNRKFGTLYNEQNFILSGTHTHSAPGGFLMHLLFDLPSLGFVKQTFTALVSGITQSILRAHNSMVEARIFLNSGELLNVNINRSPAAYLFNPEEERNEYKYDVDKEMTQLKFLSAYNNEPLGVINWFAVHPTSMNNTNRLVSSDNVGYASILFEEYANGGLPGKGPFVASFASSNLGDVSPNIKGPHCLNSGLPCNDVSSTCDGEAKICIASGPGRDMFESTRLIATRLFEKAKELWGNGNEQEVLGPLRVGHQFVDMPKQTAHYIARNGSSIKVRGCLPAMGYSFAAGTTDGPGEFDFKQATLTGNRMWNTLRDLIAAPTSDEKECHYPKPILLNTGKISFPYEWQPKIVSVQVALLGDVAIGAVPGEFTTMSGRRLRKAIAAAYQQNGRSVRKVIIAGLSNVYSDYITTPEEYQLQRYEGASTIYGPHTLTIYLKVYRELTNSLLLDRKIDPGPNPPDFSNKLISLVPPVIFDCSGFTNRFGECIQQPHKRVKRGEVVKAIFISGNPRNNLMHGKTFLTVEKFNKENWDVVATDSNWETKFIWMKSSKLSPNSEAIIEWETGSKTELGTYRIRHIGFYRYIFGGIHPYEGLTEAFEVVDN